MIYLYFDWASPIRRKKEKFKSRQFPFKGIVWNFHPSHFPEFTTWPYLNARRLEQSVSSRVTIYPVKTQRVLPRGRWGE